MILQKPLEHLIDYLSEAPNVHWRAVAFIGFDFRCELLCRDIECLVYFFCIFFEAKCQVKVANLEFQGGVEGFVAICVFPWVGLFRGWFDLH